MVSKEFEYYHNYEVKALVNKRMFEEGYIHPEHAYKALVEIMDSELDKDAEAMGIPSIKLR